MSGLLDSLHALCEVEGEVRELQSRIARREGRVRAQERRLAEAAASREAKRELLLRVQAEAGEYDLEIRTIEEQVGKLRTVLNQSKTNKEYSSVLIEINTAKANSAKIETTALHLMEQTEALETELATMDEARQKGEAKLGELVAACEAFKQETASELAAKENRLATASDPIPPQAMATFRRVAENYDGDALAQVMQRHPRRLEFSCNGCNMTVTLEQVNALKLRDDLQVCNVCGRILFLETSSRRPLP